MFEEYPEIVDCACIAAFFAALWALAKLAVAIF